MNTSELHFLHKPLMHFSYISPPRCLNAPACSLHYYLVKLKVKLQPTSIYLLIFALTHSFDSIYHTQSALSWKGHLVFSKMDPKMRFPTGNTKGR